MTVIYEYILVRCQLVWLHRSPGPIYSLSVSSVMSVLSGDRRTLPRGEHGTEKTRPPAGFFNVPVLKQNVYYLSTHPFSALNAGSYTLIKLAFSVIIVHTSEKFLHFSARHL